jgi:hypothetical protein
MSLMILPSIKRPKIALIENLIPELIQILVTIYKISKRDFYKAFLNITPLSLLNTVSNELAKIQEEQNTFNNRIQLSFTAKFKISPLLLYMND